MPRTSQKTNPDNPDAAGRGAEVVDVLDDVDDGVDGESSEEAEAEVIEQLQAGSRPRRAGGDPVADSDPNAEDASLAADADGLSKVRALKDETEQPSPKNQDAKGAGGRDSRRSE